MSRRREEEESSLELLLDTMCNTFGGVMFIAISIFVIIVGMVQHESMQNDQTVSDPVQIRQEIESLRTVLAELQHKLQLKNEQLRIQQMAKIEEKFREIMLFTQTLKDLQLKKQALMLAEKTSKKTIAKLMIALQDLEKNYSLQENEKNKLAQQLLALQQQLDKLQKNKISQIELNFKVMRSSSKAPFFMILKGNQVWPVGPWITPGKPDQPDQAVDFKKIQDQQMHIIQCTPRSGCGVNVLAGENLAPEFSALLKTVPADRIPRFYIHPDAAPTAFKMRELLKTADLQHGCSLAPDNTSPFSYQYTPDAKYEY